MSELDTPAPAPAPDPVPAPVPTAVDSAVIAGDQATFRAARAAERSGKPLAPAEPVEVSPVEADALTTDEPVTPAPVVPVTPALSKKQHDANERTRKAVEAATRDLQAENARLRATQSAPAPAVTPPSAVNDPEPDPDNTTTYPEGQFDRKYLKDQARWEARQEYRAQQTAEREQTAQQQQRTTYETSVAKYVARRDAADPAAVAKIDPSLFAALVPSALLAPGTPRTFANVLADQVLELEHPVEVLVQLSDPAELPRLAALEPAALFRALGRLDARFDVPSSEVTTPPAPTPMTAAPDPPTTFGKRPADAADPITSAVHSGDMTAFKAARLQQRVASLR